MESHQEQGEGPLAPGRGAAIVAILLERKSKPTLVTLDSGETSVGANWSFGRDIDADWEHVYFVEDGLDFFLSTEHIVSLKDPATGARLYSREDA